MTKAKHATPEARREARRKGMEKARAGANKGPIPKKPKPPVAPGCAAEVGPPSSDLTEILALIERCLEQPQRAAVRENLYRRRLLLRVLVLRQDLWAATWDRCKDEIDFYVDMFVWQYNPFKPGQEVGPFVLWDFQKDALAEMQRCYREGESAIIEKSREMGASWLLLILMDHCCRFFEWQKWLAISRSADAVDAPADPDSLFWKLDFIHENLPGPLQGERRQLKERKRFHIHYPRTRSTITGQASTGRAGVGGRAHGILIDEFSMIAEDREVRQRTASTGRVRLFNGTHQGMGTEFYRLTQTPEIKKLVMHWSQHPDKNQGLYSYDTEHRKLRFWEYVPDRGHVEIPGPRTPYPAGFDFVLDGSPTGGPHPGLRSPWYDAKARDIGTARGVSQELDIDPKGSVSTPFDPLLIHVLKQDCKAPLWEGDIAYSEKGEPEGLKEVKGGPLKLWVRPLAGKLPMEHYGMGCDVSSGTGNTPSVASAANGKTGEKILEYANAHIAPDKFALVCAALGRMLRDYHGTPARIIWEHAGPGVLFARTLMKQAGYANVWSGPLEERLRPGISKEPGFRPNVRNKNVLVTRYIIALQNREFHNWSEAALNECLEFKYDPAGAIVHMGEVGADPEAARENHGDRVIADALANKVIEEGGRLVTQTPAPEPVVPADENIMTFAGRRAYHERQKEEEEAWA